MVLWVFWIQGSLLLIPLFSPLVQSIWYVVLGFPFPDIFGGTRFADPTEWIALPLHPLLLHLAIVERTLLRPNNLIRETIQLFGRVVVCNVAA